MPATTVTLAGRRFVILPESEYRTLCGRNRTNGAAGTRKARLPESYTVGKGGKLIPRRMTAQDWGDVAEHKRRMAQGKGRPYSELRKELGLA